MKHTDNMDSGDIRICYVASSGGHLAEICRMSGLIKRFPGVLITEKESYPISFFGKKVYTIPKMNRHELKGIGHLFSTYRTAEKILKDEKINFVVTTGAMCSVPVCLAAKHMGIKVIYVESFARVETPSMTGKIMYHVADLFLVQWKDLLQFYPKAVYGGSLF
ncbi:MAG: PssD/Cps14F family polysaccharide biosynthesis glycosyltransferase [Chordicoccus sp.]